MSTLGERLSARLIDIESQIASVKARADDELGRLKAEKQTLEQAAKVLTPEIETAAANLKQLGVKLDED